MYLIIRKKHVISAALCIVLALAVGIFFTVRANQNTVSAAAANTNWGLSFQKDGAKPVGNASPEFLKQYDSYYVGPGQDKVIYLTFDAGYENGYTPAILDALKKHDVKATFFVVGNYISSNPDLIKRMVAEGHTVGNHTHSHPDMSKISSMDSFQRELQSLEQLYKDTTGQDMEKFYRPPQGKFSEENLKMAKELGYQTVFWSLAYVDWYVDNQPTKEQAFSKLLPRIHPNAVVLLHSTSKTNAEILDELLTKWKEMGYTFGTLQQLTQSSTTTSSQAPAPTSSAA